MPRPSQDLLSEGFFEFKKSAGEGLCWVKGCHRESRHDRCLCNMHEMRRWRAKKKKTADYCTLRDHANARGIEFKITLDYWRGLVDAFAYYEPKEDEVPSIDRVDAAKGYVEGNIRVVSVSLNSFKSQKERYLPEHVQQMLERKREQTRKVNKKFIDMKPGEELALWDDADYAESEDEGGDDTCPF